MGVSFRPTRERLLTDVRRSNSPALPQPARPGCRWSGEGLAAGRSRRDAKRPPGDRGSWHADRGWDARCRHHERADVRPEDLAPQPMSIERTGRRGVTAVTAPIPIQSPTGSTRPTCLRTSPTMKGQVRGHITEEPQLLNHAGRVRDVLAYADQRCSAPLIKHVQACVPTTRRSGALRLTPRVCPGGRSAAASSGTATGLAQVYGVNLADSYIARDMWRVRSDWFSLVGRAWYLCRRGG